MSNVGPRIVRVWFDTVINPLLQSLEIEQFFLNKRNWTWRFRPAALEYIRAVKSQVGAMGHDNLEQVMLLEPTVGALVTEHDHRVAALKEACRSLHDAIVNSEALRELYTRVTAPEALAALGTTLQSIFGAYGPQDHLNVLAENIVNGARDLPDYYSTHALWSRHGADFLAIRQLPGIAEGSNALDGVGASLTDATLKLAQILRETRLRLSLALDVPYVLPGAPPREFSDFT